MFPFCKAFDLPPEAARVKRIIRGSAIASPRCAAPNPGKGLRPLHSLRVPWKEESWNSANKLILWGHVEPFIHLDGVA
jgi:hypothetical protein